MTPEDGSNSDVADLAGRYGLASEAAAGLEVMLERLAADPRAPTAVKDRGQALDRHLADSLAGLELEAVRNARLAADLGSGAGLPGLALAAALPGLEVRLVEAQQSKCSYIATLIAAMGLANARVVCSRAESWQRGGRGARSRDGARPRPAAGRAGVRGAAPGAGRAARRMAGPPRPRRGGPGASGLRRSWDCARSRCARSIRSRGRTPATSTSSRRSPPPRRASLDARASRRAARSASDRAQSPQFGVSAAPGVPRRR